MWKEEVGSSTIKMQRADRSFNTRPKGLANTLLPKLHLITVVSHYRDGICLGSIIYIYEQRTCASENKYFLKKKPEGLIAKCPILSQDHYLNKTWLYEKYMWGCGGIRWKLPSYFPLVAASSLYYLKNEVGDKLLSTQSMRQVIMTLLLNTSLQRNKNFLRNLLQI